MYDLIIEVLHTVWRNGIGLTALGTVVFVLLKQRKVKKRLQRYIPWLLEDESETRHYVENQRRIESKVDLLLRERGIPWDAPIYETLKTSTGDHRTSYIFSSVEVSAAQDAARRGIWSYTKSIIRRVKKMKSYLKKLGRTKFQALLASLIVNGISAYLFLSGTLDIDGVLNTWMPIVNLTVGTVSTWVYIIVEGGIDKANVGGHTNEEFKTSTEHFE